MGARPTACRRRCRSGRARPASRPSISHAPGMSGSSGSHLRRRLPIEIDLMDAALDLLKQRFHTTSFILVGHSGGGHIVASLLNRRNDIDAAIISSGMVSVRQVVDYWTRRRKVPDSMIYDVDHYYDPIPRSTRSAKIRCRRSMSFPTRKTGMCVLHSASLCPTVARGRAQATPHLCACWRRQPPFAVP
jgi:pimeloyl-ACP methyl ester carboxylesterase